MEQLTDLDRRSCSWLLSAVSKALNGERLDEREGAILALVKSFLSETERGAPIGSDPPSKLPAEDKPKKTKKSNSRFLFTD